MIALVVTTLLVFAISLAQLTLLEQQLIISVVQVDAGAHNGNCNDGKDAAKYHNLRDGVLGVLCHKCRLNRLIVLALGEECFQMWLAITERVFALGLALLLHRLFDAKVVNFG